MRWTADTVSLPIRPTGLLSGFRSLSIASRSHARAPAGRSEYAATVIGPAGVTAIADHVAQALGAPVLAIRDDETFAGCEPLTHLASLRCLRVLAYAYHVKRSAGEDPVAPVPHVMERVRLAGAADESDAAIERWEQAGHGYVRGRARFVDAHHAQVGTRVWATDRTIIVGSRPSPQPWSPEQPPSTCISSAEVWSLQAVGGRLTVVGAEPDALAYAQAFARLGSAVTLVIPDESLLAGFDPLLARQLLDHLRGDGVDVRTGHRADGPWLADASTWIDADGTSHVIAHDRLIWCTPAATASVDGIEAPALRLRGDCFDGFRGTTHRDVFLCDRFDGPQQFVHPMLKAGWRAGLRDFLSGGGGVGLGTPRIVLTYPELAAVGATEAELISGGRSYDDTSLRADEHDRGFTAQLRTWSQPISRAVVGACLLAYRAAEELAHLAAHEPGPTTSDAGGGGATATWRIPDRTGRFAISYHCRRQSRAAEKLARLGPFALCTSILALVMTVAAWSLSSGPVVVSSSPPTPEVSLGRALGVALRDDGTVDEKRLRAAAPDLRQFLAAAANVDASSYSAWSTAKKVAFWCNVANALYLDALAVSSDPGESTREPSLDRWQAVVMGEPVSLDQIKDEILPRLGADPRWRFAVAYSRHGPSPIRLRPFREGVLDRQLDDQMRRVLGDQRLFAIDRESDRVLVSERFRKAVSDHTDDGRAALGFIANYLSTDDRERVLGGRCTVVWQTAPPSAEAPPPPAGGGG